MVRSLFYGVIIFLTIVLGAILIGNLQMAMTFGGGLGLVCLLSSPILSRAFANGNTVHIKLSHESQQYRRLRLKWIGRTLFFAMPNLVGAVAVFFLHFY
ncbi:hypothetical protein JOD43_002477 [Pullulanibacillus pueri]|uniref:Uncharacterized protein n=1 Tax=Pullulanibacillus pueri TaxID=1437324 RepID=A0A8J2ZV93_9BACL|nr:DUF5316 family protein [Pullulanibacillus pueri]MBM7682302.1 hypothetical protein [Pullulanibacillus pueri]GGH80878.1 hypothetical protein GCM10007096_17940 [Pullulanibacillus pueri]